MVADIGYRYISEGAKGSALEHKKIGRLIANGDQSSAPAARRATAPPSLNLAPSDLWSILYIRYFLLSIAPICLIYVSFRAGGHPAPALAWPASTPKVLRPLSREIHLLPIHARPLDITKDLLVMQTRRYIKTIYFANAIRSHDR